MRIPSDPYYNFIGSSSFLIPSSPISASSHKRKRSEDLDNTTRTSINNETNNDQGKRYQQHKIHTEVHRGTIELMMKSQKILQEQERMQKLYDQDDSMYEDIDMQEPKDNFKQKPFWPTINKVHT